MRSAILPTAPTFVRSYFDRRSRTSASVDNRVCSKCASRRVRLMTAGSTGGGDAAVALAMCGVVEDDDVERRKRLQSREDRRVLKWAITPTAFSGTLQAATSL